jgi:hypothetical protein
MSGMSYPGDAEDIGLNTLFDCLCRRLIIRVRTPLPAQDMHNIVMQWYIEHRNFQNDAPRIQRALIGTSRVAA